MTSAPAHACVDSALPLAPSLADPGTYSDRFTRDGTVYMLRGLVAWDQADGLVDGGDRLVVGCEALAAAAAAPLAAALDPVDGTLLPRKVREAFEALYLDTIAVRGQDAWIGRTTAALQERTGYKGWDVEVFPRSLIKRKTRVVYRSPAGFEPEISVSETLDSETGDRAAPVLETEVAIARRGGGAGGGAGQWDFYAYDEAGELAGYSTFPAGRKPAPQICISCHYDGGARTVSRFLRRP